MSRFARPRAACATFALLALGGLAAGCGGSDEPDLVNGKELFTSAQCASCHTLARANATGTQGPNLDEAFGPSRQAGLGKGTVAGVVEDQITNVRRGSIMPEDLVTGEDARDVAAYVATVAGVPGEDAGALATAGAPEVSDEPVVAEDGTLVIPAAPTGALAFTANMAESEPGEVELVMPNESSVQHNIALRGDGVQEEGAVVGMGEESTVTAEVDPGEYQFYCSVPGHEEGGMIGDLAVE